MAFTNSQRISIFEYLGARIYGSQFDPMVDNAVAAFEAMNNADAEARVVVILGQLAELDAQLVTGAARGKYKRVEDVEYNVGGEVGTIAQIGTILVTRLANILGTVVLKNPFRGSVQGGVMRHG